MLSNYCELIKLNSVYFILRYFLRYFLSHVFFPLKISCVFSIENYMFFLFQFNKKADVHKSLMLSHPRFLPECDAINLEKFISIYNFEDSFSQETKDSLKSNLLKDINTLNRELNPNKQIFLRNFLLKSIKNMKK